MKPLVACSLVALFLLGVCAPARAQESSAAPTISAPVPSIASDADPATATRAWLDTVPADKRAKSDAYFEGGYWLILWNFLMTAAISLFLLNSRISARLRDLAERWTRFKTMQVVLYAIPFVLLTALLQFPLNVYQNFFREHKYGLATQTFGPWLGEQIQMLLIGVVAVSILLILLYPVFRRAPRTWWIWATLVLTGFQLAGAFIFPVFIAPIFNKYTPLEDSALRESILSLARANQIPVDKVFVVDASRQTTRVSANVAGFLGTTRIALNDNLLNQCTLPEIRQVMGHEMGHYVLNHGMKLTIYSALFFLVGFALIRVAFNAAVRRWGERWGVRDLADPAGLPLLVLLLSGYFFLITPLDNTATRVTEAEADIFGMNAAREPDGFAQAALKLGTYRKLDPTPLEEFIFFDHPSGRARIRMAMDWKAAHVTCGSSETKP
jgi:STE24 endopeptidase